ncbi:LmbE family N-acetylglucosaminyl deacetylase [Salinibacter ruber]|uniref:PIG-L deacetylase family protein n=1 Tax=Salinibacter ruber TaxID=146919 RepID=UPI0021691D5F|nr:PIG-L family deacetylase [Salinibacter ruber]MCS4194430.1 LmbE family N-acetylglucosaminyl deacetylase [Salinibacter ruber]
MMQIVLGAVVLLLGMCVVAGVALFVRDWALVVQKHEERDGDYALDPDHTQKVEIKHGQFHVDVAPGRTCFLEVEIRSSWLGWIYPSKLILDCEGERTRQYAGLGASGSVYVNLAILEEVEEAKQTIEITCQRGSVISDTGTLLVFEDPPLRGASLCVVAPHPDDAEISAFGLYSDPDIRASVVTVTAGDRGQYTLGNPVRDASGIPRDALKGEIRVWDSVTIPNLGGVPFDRCYNLGYLDGTLSALAEQGNKGDTEGNPSATYRRGTIPTSEEEAASGWATLVGDLASIFRREQPNYLVCPHPELDCYDEHRRATDAAIEAVRRLEEESSPSHFLFYVVHNSVTNFFPFGPPHGLVTLPPHAEGTANLATRPFSYSLSEKQVVKKQYGLEAMHELRRVELPEWDGRRSTREVVHTVVRALKQLLRVPTETTSSLDMIDRAARPNEIFFTVPTERVIGERESHAQT